MFGRIGGVYVFISVLEANKQTVILVGRIKDIFYSLTNEIICASYRCIQAFNIVRCFMLARKSSRSKVDAYHCL